MPSLPYVVRRGLWMVHSALQLIAALGTGIYWIVQLYRLTLYSFLMLFYFLPHAWWYLTSPSVIRRVCYREECNDSMTDDNHVQSSRSSESNSTSWEKGTHISSSSSATSMHDCGARRSQSRHRQLDIAPIFLSRIFTSSAAKTSTAQIPKMKNKNAHKYYDIFNKPKEGVESKDMKNEKGRSSKNRNSDVHPSSSQCPSDTRGARATSPRQQTTHYSRDDAPSSSPHHALPHCTGVASASSAAYNEWDNYNRATLDVVLPVPFDVVMKALEDKNQRRRTHRHHLQRKKFPIVILFTGGAWIIGSQMWSTMLARVLASRGYVVFCPDYRNFPQATMEGMTLDVSDAIAWVLRNAERYNGDLEDVTLLGQSAGAHLTMMSLLSQAQWLGFKAKGGKPSSLSPPSSVAYNVPRYNPRASIRRYIGLSGFYNIEAQATHFHQKGLNRSLLHKIAGGKENMPRYSLNSYFDPCRQGDTGEVLPDNIFDFLPPKMYFLHGDADETSSAQDCAAFVMAVKSTQYAFLLERTKTLAERRAHEKRSSRILPGYMFDPFVLNMPEKGSPRGQEELRVGENSGKRMKGEIKRTTFSAAVLSSDPVRTAHHERVRQWHTDHPVKEEKVKQKGEKDAREKREGSRERGERKRSERKRTMTPAALFVPCTASTREGVHEEGMGNIRSVDGDEQQARSHGETSSPVSEVGKMGTQGKERKREEKPPQRKLRRRFPSSSSLSSLSSPLSWPAMTNGHASNSFPSTKGIKTMTTAIAAPSLTSPQSKMESPLYAVSSAFDATPTPQRSLSTHLPKSVRQRSAPQPSSAWLSLPPTAPPPSMFSASIVHTTSELYTLPCTPCEIRFLIIPGSRHTDPLVEECLCAGRSCCADFLCDYDEFDFPSDPTTSLWDSSTPAMMKGFPSLKGNGDDTAVANKMMRMAKHGSSSRRPTSSSSHSGSPFAPFITREYLTPRNRRAAPDGFLPLAVSFNERGMLMKWCSSVCPF